ncbi:MAG: radical SAM protein [Azospirillaceae bacterium]
MTDTATTTDGSPGAAGPPLMADGRPGHPDARVLRSPVGSHLFAVDGSRLYDIPDDLADRLERDLAGGDTAGLEALLAQVAPAGGRYIGPESAEPPALRAISLNVAQACNMGCGYCYADEGRFGGKARGMTLDTAKAVIDRLIAESEPGGRIVVGFMGGEPLMRRDLVHAATHYAADRAAAAGRALGFSLTTNLTLLTEDDAALFRDHGFAVQVSLDGPAAVNDGQRPMRRGGGATAGGAGSHARALDALTTIERVGRPRQLAARATVTPKSGALVPILDHLLGLGFDEVGFSAVTRSPDPSLAFDRPDFARFLAWMTACGEKALAAVLRGERYAFSNFHTALAEIHRGTHRPYPCGAGAGYLSANAEGDLYACHRLVDDPAHAMGDTDGTDVEARRAHLAARHVDRQEPCRRCWARYLCGGGCYHEVDAVGRLACDHIRGWLAFCLAAYATVSQEAPGYFR